VPAGALLAILLLVAIHLAATAVYTEPVARCGLREKTRILTRDCRPSVVVAGDSAFQCGVLPELLAERLGRPKCDVINIAESACDTPAFLAAYREFAHRLAPSHIVVLNVSSFAANDGAAGLVGEEFLWSLGLRQRLNVTDAGRAIASCFLPEQALWDRLLKLRSGVPAGYPLNGFGARHPGDDVSRWSTPERQRDVNKYARLWYGGLKMNGLRRQRLHDDLRALVADGVHLVVVLMPFHPFYEKAIQGTPAADAESGFRADVRALCRQMGITCLSYRADCLGTPRVDPLFRDMLHFTQQGAVTFTTVLADDLRALGSAGSGPNLDSFAARQASLPGREH